MLDVVCDSLYSSAVAIEIHGESGWLTTQEAAGYLGVELSTIYKYKRIARLKEGADWVKVHGRHYFRQSSLDAINVGKKADDRQ